MKNLYNLVKIASRNDFIGDYDFAEIVDRIILAIADPTTINWNEPDAWKQLIPVKQDIDVKETININQLNKSARNFVNLLKVGKISGELSRSEFDNIAKGLGFEVSGDAGHFYVFHEKPPRKPTALAVGGIGVQILY